MSDNIDRRAMSEHDRRLVKLEVKTEYHAQRIEKILNSLDKHISAEALWQEKIVFSIQSLQMEVARFKNYLLGGGGVVVLIWVVSKDLASVIKLFGLE